VHAPSTPAASARDGRAPADATDDALIGVSLGRELRAARTARKLSMRALAAAADISQPFLSQIESGHTMPSISTLFRLAKVLGISPSALLPSPPEPDPVRVSRRGEGDLVPVTESDDRATSRIIVSETDGGATVQEYALAGPYLGDWFESDGQNTVYVVEGRLTVMIEGRGEWELGPGDALTHPGGFRNRWALRDAAAATVLLVHAPLA
jgi:transcriptional regulator with XRE-family HTH domain